MWYACIYVYRNVVNELGAGGVGRVNILTDNSIVKGENEAG